tara:strand:+ start:165 stop:281 length:117 start_codon:yes stop_codon:yes gene_type:complete
MKLFNTPEALKAFDLLTVYQEASAEIDPAGEKPDVGEK